MAGSAYVYTRGKVGVNDDGNSLVENNARVESSRKAYQKGRGWRGRVKLGKRYIQETRCSRISHTGT